MVVCLFFGTNGFAQVINATLTGTVSDNSGALIPGVEITATNADTGIVSKALTNETGTYRFASLQPGPYQVSASLAGFQSQIFQITLGTSQQIRQNFILLVGGVAQTVDVSVAADQLLTAVSSSVGNVLPERQVMDLPLVDRNVMNLALILPGVVAVGTGTNGNAGTTFAGIPSTGSANVSVTMDGVTMNTGRHQTGIATNTAINPDMVEEMRVVVAAVDVEGRASAQIQVRSRSGTYQFHGALTWNVQNSILNANSWTNNMQGAVPIWYNRHQYTATLGGPIIRKKTFFFGMFDGLDGQQRQTMDTTILTDTARQGIFRFFPGVNNGNTQTTASGSGNTRVAPVVDQAGNPLDYRQIPGATGPMQSFSVFGDALNPGGPFRRGMDTTGFIAKVIANMPHANVFGNGPLGGDGLNTATSRWVLHTIGGPGGGTAPVPDAFRKEFYIKIDHQFNQNHRITGNYTHEYRYTDNNSVSPWPNGFRGDSYLKPRDYAVQLTSTLSPTLLNEFRGAYRLTSLQDSPSYHSTTNGTAAFNFLTKINGLPVLQRPTLFPDHMIGPINDFGHRSPLSTYADTLSWTRGAHAIKTGVEFRFANSASWVMAPGNLMPIILGGAGDVPVTGIDKIPGMLPANIALAQNLLLSLAGSISSISQKFEIREPTDTTFRNFFQSYFDPSAPTNGRRGAVRDWHQNEVNFFIKDDWRVTPNLTLNLGIRYDLMRVPYMLSATGKNMTPGFVGGSAAIFGYSGRSIGGWMSGGTPQMGTLTQTALIGKDTQYPNQGIWPSDKNNFGPGIGFAWSPHRWGKDKTTVRGGYQIAYQLPGNSLSFIDSDVGKSTPGLTYEPIDRGDGTYRDFSNMVVPLPLPSTPFQVVPITQGSQAVVLFAPDYTTPYVQTFTLGVTRSLASNLTLNVSYVGTRGVKIHSGLNLNDVDIRHNGVLQALQITRAGGNAPMFDQMLKGLDIGSGVVGVAVSGSEAFRQKTTLRTLIANGDFVGVARILNTTNIGTVQPAGQVVSGGTLRSSGLFPANFFVVNPQFSTITYRNNEDSSNYHSLQTQVTLRPTHGFDYQATYTWSRSLGVNGGLTGAFRDLQNQRADYTLEPTNRTHDFRSYGTLELPFGPGKLLAGNSSGWLARVIEGWKIGSIFNANSGAPIRVVGGNTLYNAGTPDIVGNFPRKGKVVWPLNKGDIFGNFFGQQYQRVPDPACANVASNLKAFCTLNALADANGNIVLQNAQPGELGTLGLNPINGPGFWGVDSNVQKSIRIHESKILTFRVDVTNVFNHPVASSPNLNINSGTFGQITTKTGSRMLSARIHLEF
jgi:hypothetical protein